MSYRAVHWHEGMFLRPHHLQAAQRFSEYQTGLLTQMLTPYCWGCAVLDIDRDALANFRFVVRRLRARLRDGTLVAIPEDGTLSAVDLRPSLEKASAVTLSLAVPLLQSGRINVSDDQNPAAGNALVRYRLDVQDIDDENTGTDRESILVRRLNLQVLLGSQDSSGYSTVPLAVVERSGRADGRPQLQTGFIPPVLACDAWPELAQGILQSLYDRIGKKMDVLADLITNRGLVLDYAVHGDALIVAQLRVLDEAYATLGSIALTPGIHPLTAYLELCRIVGQLALFGPTHRAPTVPRYDHDDLGGCFFKLKRYIDEILDLVVEPEYKDRAFIGAGLRMEVGLESAWVESNWQMFIGVQSPLSADELVRVLTQPGGLDMKVGSSERVDAIFRYGRAGLRFVPVRNPPRVLPTPTGLTYFQLATDAANSEWTEVQKSLTLAIRLNENRVIGTIQDQRDLTIQVGNQTTTLRFTLFVVPRKSLGNYEVLS